MKDTDLQNKDYPASANKMKIAAVLLGIFGLVMAFGYWIYIRWMWYGWFPQWDEKGLSIWERFTEGSSYYTHGPLIPVICAGMFVWLVKKIHLEIKPARWWGLGFIAAGQILYLLGSFARIRFVLGWFAMLVLIGLVLMMWGWPIFRRIWFIFAFAIFAMPMSHVQIAGFSYHLRMIATDMAVNMANGIGIICEHSLNTILLSGGESMIVGDVCSGLRTLISLLAFGAIYAYICRLRGWKQLLLFCLVVPVGLVCNALRIAAIIAVAHWGNVEFATGTFHDNSGIFIFILAFLIMFAMEKLIMWICKKTGHPVEVRPLFDKWRLSQDQQPAGKQLLAAFASKWMVIAVIFLAVTNAWGWKLARRPLIIWNNATVNAGAPDKITIGQSEYQGRTLLLSDQILRILNTKDYFYRQYMSVGEAPVSVLVVYSQDNRVTTHAPEVCITAAGGEIVSTRDVEVSVDGIGSVACKELIVEDSGRYTCYLYTLRASDGYTDNIWTQQAVIFANGIIGRNASGALIRLSSPFTQQEQAATREKLTKAMQAVLPHLDKAMDTP